jgi:hypothetical protein
VGAGRITARLGLALAVASLCSAAGAGDAAGAHRAKHVCSKPPPGSAACLAERLLISPGETPAGARAAARRSLARTHRISRHAGIENKKPYAGYLTPERLHGAYGLPAETPAGATQTIALVDAYNDPTAEADLAVFDSEFGLPECTTADGCFTKLNQEGRASPLPADQGEWAAEISIDVQMAHAICESCRIMLVEASSEEFEDLGAAVNAAVAAGATIVSNSYGETEAPSYVSLAETDYSHPGIPVLASSGDCGYLNGDCPALRSGANFPASAAGVIAVGGTSLSEHEGTWTSSAWSEAGSGCSTVFDAAPWQSAVAGFPATGCGSGRAVADIAAVADPATGVDVYDSTPEEPGGPTGWGVWGGTSVASPILAGEFGLAGGSLGVAYPAATLYAHAGEAGAIEDVTSGANGECGSATICRALTGYDGPTGLGSPVGLGAFALGGLPENLSAPTVSGVPEQGEVLSEAHGSWSGSPTSYAYQWERCDPTGTDCHPIAGASAQTYTPGEADVGSKIRVRESARNEVGPASADSAPVGPVASDVPAITGLSTYAGITGSRLIVEGSALDTATAVTLGAGAAPFTVLSPAKLEVTVPDGAKSGKISVTTAHGSVRSKAKFTVTLSITAFKPAGAEPGRTVTIKGTGFTASSAVAFDGTPATVLSESARKLKVLVPAGAASGPITVTNVAAPAGTVASALVFTP